MFSSDVRKIRAAELKAQGDGGTIQRLRKCCDDSAEIMEKTADLVVKNRMSRKQRAELAQHLRRGASLLRLTASVSPPESAK